MDGNPDSDAYYLLKTQSREWFKVAENPWYATSVREDGQTVVIQEHVLEAVGNYAPPTGMELGIRDHTGQVIATSDQRFLRPPWYGNPAQYSPDGRRIACLASMGSGREIVLLNGDDLTVEGRIPIPIPGHVFPGSRFWAPDGEHIILAKTTHEVASITLRTGEITYIPLTRRGKPLYPVEYHEYLGVWDENTVLFGRRDLTAKNTSITVSDLTTGKTSKLCTAPNNGSPGTIAMPYRGADAVLGDLPDDDTPLPKPADPALEPLAQALASETDLTAQQLAGLWTGTIAAIFATSPIACDPATFAPATDDYGALTAPDSCQAHTDHPDTRAALERAEARFECLDAQGREHATSNPTDGSYTPSTVYVTLDGTIRFDTDGVPLPLMYAAALIIIRDEFARVAITDARITPEEP